MEMMHLEITRWMNKIYRRHQKIICQLCPAPRQNPGRKEVRNHSYYCACIQERIKKTKPPQESAEVYNSYGSAGISQLHQRISTTPIPIAPTESAEIPFDVSSPRGSFASQRSEQMDEYVLTAPSMCGFRGQPDSLPIYDSNAYMIDSRWIWDWILQLGCITHFPDRHRAGSPFNHNSTTRSWAARDTDYSESADGVETKVAPPSDKERTSSGHELGGVDLHRLRPKLFLKSSSPP